MCLCCLLPREWPPASRQQQGSVHLAPPLPVSPCTTTHQPLRDAEEERRRLREEASKHKYNQMAPPMAAYRSEVAIAAVESTIAGNQGGGAPSAPSAASLAEKRALIARTAAELDEEARRKAEQVCFCAGVGACVRGQGVEGLSGGCCPALLRRSRPQAPPGSPTKDAAGLCAHGAAALPAVTRVPCPSALQTVQQLGMDVQSNPGAKLLAKMGFGTTGEAWAGAGSGVHHCASPAAKQHTRSGSGRTVGMPRQPERADFDQPSCGGSRWHAWARPCCPTLSSPPQARAQGAASRPQAPRRWLCRYVWCKLRPARRSCLLPPLQARDWGATSRASLHPSRPSLSSRAPVWALTTKR